MAACTPFRRRRGPGNNVKVCVAMSREAAVQAQGRATLCWQIVFQTWHGTAAPVFPCQAMLLRTER
jgi:hypothetical protein